MDGVGGRVRISCSITESYNDPILEQHVAGNRKTAQRELMKGMKD